MTQAAAQLPENILLAIGQFEASKNAYEQLQIRLGQLAKRLEKHRMATDASNEESSQLGAQWRAQFRESDGELTKEIRTLKTREQEARELAGEYAALAKELEPEFELCQLDAYQARAQHLHDLKVLQDLYADHIFTQAADKLFSSPEATAFFVGLNHRFKNIDSYYQETETARIVADEELAGDFVRNRQGKYLLSILQKHLDAVAAGDTQEESFAQYTELAPGPNELIDQSPAWMNKKRQEVIHFLSAQGQGSTQSLH